MAKEWKVLQEIYHRMTEEHSDASENFDMLYRPDTIIKDCKRYIDTKDLIWFYPAKSYIVAICYASWLAQDFDEDFYSLLNDPDLLYGNDPYFITYNNSVDMYDKVIKLLGAPNPLGGVVPDIRCYYENEFMLNTKT
jgi:hypothetical protein